MNVFVIGNSATLGKGLPPQEQFANVLQSLLEDRLPGRSIEVEVRGWGYLSQERLEILEGDVFRRGPDYLLLEPSLVWVTLPMVEPAIRRRIPPRHVKTFDWFFRANHRFEDRLLRSRWSGLFAVYHWPLYVMGRLIFGAEPLHDVPEATGYVDRFMQSVKRLESMSVLVLGGVLPPTEAIVQHHTWKSVRRFIPQESIETLREFTLAVRSLSSQHHLHFLDTWSVLYPTISAKSFLSDSLHPTGEVTRLRAEVVCDAIASIEADYAHEDPVRRREQV